MKWAAKQHPVETIVDWLAPVPLALAVGWAGEAMGVSDIARAAVAGATLIAGFATMKLLGGQREADHVCFDLAPIEAVAPELGELILEPKDELLELTHRLEEVELDSRVVRLFAKVERTPGELVDRISDFLGESQRSAGTAEAPREAAPPADASASLHEALAKIRASLR